ncbi:MULTISPECIES: hypothetical protein [Gammaproteobacteria]|uniref:hypothetical protein n=1 Tax=Gammaproteobacteria TaxID=1236 RepID=UPI000DD03B95|nr:MULTISPECIES: hypothetical protein [Gammaproteobacteria]RTE85518.1 hypothetical protein DQX04_11485 [Aliidiomarina sp. B3213]TCZ89488.1 hypothetical protein EYQ95_11415 [Lysobacter sp. N42]
MESKIILGLLMGFFAGSASKAILTANTNPALAPVNRGWFNISTSATPVITIIWIISTFVTYPAKYGFFAIGEVVIGAIIAGVISPHSRIFVAQVALPASIISWVTL